MTLILRKLLASSTYAISDTLLGLANKLEAVEKAQAALDSPPDDLPRTSRRFKNLKTNGWKTNRRSCCPAQYCAATFPEQREELRLEKKTP